MRRQIAAIPMVALLVAACDGGKSAAVKCPFTSTGGGATAQFSLDSSCETNPFPSDVLRSGTTINIPVNRMSYILPKGPGFDKARTYLQTTIDSLDSDGFSVIAPIIVPMNHQVDVTTAAAGVKLFVMGTGATPSATLDTTHTLTASWDDQFRALMLQPDRALEEGTTYGVAITTGLLDLQGLPTTRARDFELYVKGTPPPEIPAILAAAAPSPDLVALAFTFRTQTVASGLVSIRDQIFGSGAVATSLVPTMTNPDPQIALLHGGYYLKGDPLFAANLLDAAGLTSAMVPNIGALATGTFDAFKFRDDKFSPFNPSYVSGAAVGPTEHIQFRLAIPSGTMPVGGWPLILYQHGLGGNATNVYDIANKAAPFGFAVIGTEAVAHGLRGGVFEIFDWDSMPITRDNFRESVADDLMLLKLVRNANAANTPPFDQLSTADVDYMGISLGGILGGTFTALAPNSPRSALIVPGGHISEELTAPGVGQEYLWNYVSARAGIDPFNDEPGFLTFVKPFMELVQTGLDPADPASYGVHVNSAGRQLGVESKRVLIQESKGDTWVPNPENEAIRKSIGAPIFTTPQTDAVNGLSGAWVYTTADFPALASTPANPIEPHSWWGKNCAEREQTFTFLQSGGTVIMDPLTSTCTN